MDNEIVARHPIPDDVLRFILLHIPSVPFLEAMLLLRSDVEDSWNSKRLADYLYIRERAAKELLDALHAGGFLIASERDLSTFRYQPESDSLRSVIDRLAAVYANNLVEISNLIHSKIDSRGSS